MLQPLHAKMEKGAETLKEISFNHVSQGGLCRGLNSMYDLTFALGGCSTILAIVSPTPQVLCHSTGRCYNGWF